MWRGYWRRAWAIAGGGYNEPTGMRGWSAANTQAGAHGDVAHGDTAHGDVAHGDSNKGHIDTAHMDTAHTDVAHTDATLAGTPLRMR